MAPAQRSPRPAFIALAVGLALGCSTTHGVKPLGKGTVSLEASLGGPITEVFGAPIPLPLTTVGTTVGVTETTNVHASVHPTGALLFNVFAGDIGASQQVLTNEGARPRLMGDLTLTLAGGDRDENEGKEGGLRFFMQPSFTASWDWGRAKKQTVYTGLTAFLEPSSEFYGLGGIYLGNRFGIGHSQVDIELKWLQPWSDNTPIVPEFFAPGNLGAVELQFAYRFVFPAKKSERPLPSPNVDPMPQDGVLP